jgi:ribosomal-protein-alanine N-acetyltransferase
MMMWIRPFRNEDTEQISKIVAEAFTEIYPKGVWADIARYWPEGVSVLLDDSTVIGTLVAVVETEGVSRVLILALKPEHRRRGGGKMLLDHHIRVCKGLGMRRVKLEVRKGNDLAMRFYERQGFKSEGTLPCFYTDGADAFQMGLAL